MPELPPRWRKVARDIARQRARSLLVVVAMVLALVGAGTVVDTWALVQRATELGYRASLPASATLGVEGLDEALVQAVRAMPGIAAVRARRTAGGLAQAGGAWRNAVVVAIDDYDDPAIARLQRDAGDWPPRDGTLLIERSSLEFAGARVGEPISLKLPSQAAPTSLPLAGVLRDVSLAPGWMEHLVYLYATPRTLPLLGLPATANELQLRVADERGGRAAVRQVAEQVRALVESRGARVGYVDVPEPGQHIHAGQMNSLLLTQAAFGVLALLVSAFLIVNLVTAMLASQRREIAVMKVLGASPAQVARLTLGHAFVLGLAASLVALPLAAWLGREYAAMKGELLNFPVAAYAIPWWVLAAQGLVGCLLPVLAAAGPVRRACRTTVVDALRDIGIAGAAGAWRSRRWLAGWPGQRLASLAIGNAFRRRQRLVLTLLALAAGGAVFLAAANLRQAVRGSVDRIFAAQAYDVTLRLAEPRPPAEIETAALAIDGVARAEAWRALRATLPAAAGHRGDRVTVLGVPASTPLLRPALRAGRWLRDGDRDALVVSESLARQLDGLRVDADLTLLIDGKPRRWRLVGVVDAGPQPLAYAERGALDALAGDARGNLLVVATAARGAAMQLDAVARLRRELAEAGIAVASSTLQQENRRVVEDHLVMVVEFLGAMGWVMIAVGGMGLASAVGLSVLERSREIGVMRTLGASHATVAAVVQIEGLAIVALGALVALPLSVPLSAVLAEAFGRIMFAVPARLWPGAAPLGQWLALTLVLSLAACAGPAWRATRVPPARALAYE